MTIGMIRTSYSLPTNTLFSIAIVHERVHGYDHSHHYNARLAFEYIANMILWLTCAMHIDDKVNDWLTSAVLACMQGTMEP